MIPKPINGNVPLDPVFAMAGVAVVVGETEGDGDGDTEAV